MTGGPGTTGDQRSRIGPRFLDAESSTHVRAGFFPKHVERHCRKNSIGGRLDIDTCRGRHYFRVPM